MLGHSSDPGGSGAGDLGTWESGDLRGRIGAVSRRGPTLARSGRGRDARVWGMRTPMGRRGVAEAGERGAGSRGHSGFHLPTARHSASPRTA